MKKPVVAVVYHFFPHYRSAVLAELLQSDKYQYRLYAGTVASDPTIKSLVPSEVIPFTITKCRYIGRFVFQSGLLKLSIDTSIDTIIFLGNPNHLSIWAAGALARLSGKTVYFWTHGWLRKEAFLKAAIRRVFYSIAHGLMLYGRRAAELGVEEGFAPDRLAVIFNSLDYRKQVKVRESISELDIKALRIKLFSDANTPVVACSARITDECRFDQLIEALIVLKTEGYTVNTILIGDGPAKDGLEKLAIQNGLRVSFVGACYDEEILGINISAANVVVSPGKVGLSAIHSLAYGRPVITHSNLNRQGPEVESIRPGLTGDLFPEGDVRSLAELIRRWTTSQYVSKKTQLDCIQIVESEYSPTRQKELIEMTLDGRNNK